MKTFKVGDRVITPNGEKGTVQSLSSPKATVQIDGGDLVTVNLSTLTKEKSE